MKALAGRTILQVIPDLSAGGAERTTIEVAEAIVAAGGRALVASRGGRLEAALQGVGGEVIHMDAATKSPRRIWANSRQIALLVRSEGIDLIHARSRAPAWSALWAARATKVPFVTTYHGAYNARSGLKRLYNSVMARGDMVIANSAWIGEHIHITHGTPRDRIVVIPRGVDLTRYHPGQVIGARLEAARRSFGLSPQERTVILLPARLTRWKGHPEAIDAFAMLNGDVRASCVLIFAGDAQGRGESVAGVLPPAGGARAGARGNGPRHDPAGAGPAVRGAGGLRAGGAGRGGVVSRPRGHARAPGVLGGLQLLRVQAVAAQLVHHALLRVGARVVGELRGDLVHLGELHGRRPAVERIEDAAVDAQPGLVGGPVGRPRRRCGRRAGRLRGGEHLPRLRTQADVRRRAEPVGRSLAGPRRRGVYGARRTGLRRGREAVETIEQRLDVHGRRPGWTVPDRDHATPMPVSSLAQGPCGRTGRIPPTATISRPPRSGAADARQDLPARSGDRPCGAAGYRHERRPC